MVDYILEETTLPYFHTIFTTNCHVAFKNFCEQNCYFKVGKQCGSFYNILFQSGASVISKRGRDSYFKVGQSLFQKGAKIISKLGSYFKVGQDVISKCGSFFNVGQLF